MTLPSQRTAVLSGLSDVVKDVADWLRQRRIEDTKLMVGVSGGADSVALLRALDECRSPLELDVIVAHLDHGLRADSAADAVWVTSLARQLGLRVITERVDVARWASDAGQGIEETAREVRYDFLLRVAEDHGCSDVAVAHTADDQAETILHHLIRGTGLAGLRGMPDSRLLSTKVTLIRPLLGTPRQSLIEFLAELEQEYRVDDTNTDEQFTRNRVRHTLLPLLREQFNPQVDRALLRLSQQANEVQEWLEVQARNELQAAMREQRAERVHLSADHLRTLSPHLLREVLRQLWLEQNWPRQRMGFDEWQRLAGLVQSPESAKSTNLPHHLSAKLDGSTLVISLTKGG